MTLMFRIPDLILSIFLISILIGVYIILILICIVSIPFRPKLNRKRKTIMMLVDTMKYHFERKTEWRPFLWGKTEHVEKLYVLAVFGKDNFFKKNWKKNNFVYEFCTPIKFLNNKFLKISYFVMRYFWAQYLIVVFCLFNRNDAIVSSLNSFYCFSAFFISKFFLRTKYILYEGVNKTARLEDKFFNNFAVRLIEKISFNYADAIFIPQKRRLEVMEFFNISQSKVFYVPHYFEKFAKAQNLKLKKPEFLEQVSGTSFFYFGRITRDKRVDVILEAFLKVLKKRKDMNLIMCGSGEKYLIENIKNNFYFGNNIFFLNYLNYDVLQNYIKFTDIHIHPTGGKAIIESGYFKKPVIVFNKYKWDYDIIENGITGLFCEFDSSEDMADKMLFLADNKNLWKEFGENIYNKIQNTFSEEMHKKHLDEAYSIVFKNEL